MRLPSIVVWPPSLAPLPISTAVAERLAITRLRVRLPPKCSNVRVSSPRFATNRFSVTSGATYAE